MRTKSLTNSKKGRKTIKTATEKTVNTYEMLGKETEVLQRTITMKEVIFEDNNNKRGFACYHNAMTVV